MPTTFCRLVSHLNETLGEQKMNLAERERVLTGIAEQLVTELRTKTYKVLSMRGMIEITCDADELEATQQKLQTLAPTGEIKGPQDSFRGAGADVDEVTAV